MPPSDPSGGPAHPAIVRNDKGGVRPYRQRSAAPPITTLIGRRQILAGAAGFALLPVLGEADIARATEPTPTPAPAPFDFADVPLTPLPHDVLADGYNRKVLIRWGDPLFADAPEFDFRSQSARAARRQFGYNNDFTAFIPLTPGASDHGLLAVNHEYPIPHLMFPGLKAGCAAEDITREQADIMMASCGLSIVEVRRRGDGWDVDRSSRFNRRVTADTPIRIAGPAAGHPSLRTAADPTGTWVLGTHDNCNGGITPWGTILSCEEGSADFFVGDVEAHPDRDHLRRNHYESAKRSRYGWERFHERFDFDRVSNEPNRFEWVVEIDPLEPDAPPVKRTALGRFAHEGAQCAIAADGRVVVYLGDDWEFEYCYRFVTARPFDPHNRAANRDLLDDGILSVARFDANGSVDWLPLVWGEGPLTPVNGFDSQADVLLETRRAADLLGATPMDSPEGYAPDPVSGHVFIALTGNEARASGQVDAANPRPNNAHGHMIEMMPPLLRGKPDHGADRFDWRIFLLCGDPADPTHGATFPPSISREGWFVEPDNIGFDPAGRLWVCSDGPGIRGHDGLWAMHVSGPDAGRAALFYSAPAQAECCSPAFTPDGRNLFLSIQHPAERAESADTVSTRWPDFADDGPPRPALIAIRQDKGGPIGGG